MIFLKNIYICSEIIFCCFRALDGEKLKNSIVMGAIKRIGELASDGSAPGMNAAICLGWLL